MRLPPGRLALNEPRCLDPSPPARYRSLPPVFEKLQSDYQRFLEIERLLLEPDISSDPSRVASLAKERGTLAKLAVPYGRYLELGRQIAEAEALLAAETDSEMRE